MSLVIFDSYSEIGRGLVVKTELESAGFHPSFENFHYASVLPHHMLALGGLKIKIPEQEYEQARAFMNAPSIDPPLDYDPIRKRKFGKWVSPLAFLSAIIGFGLLPFFVCIIFLKFRSHLAIIFIINMIIALFCPQYMPASLFISAMFSGLIALLAHAEYIAGPKILAAPKA